MSFTESFETVKTFAIGCYEKAASNAIYIYGETAEIVSKNYPAVRDVVKDYSGRTWTWIKDTAKAYPFATVLVANAIVPFLAMKVGDCVKAVWLELCGEELDPSVAGHKVVADHLALYQSRKITVFSSFISYGVAGGVIVGANYALSQTLKIAYGTYAKAAGIGFGIFVALFITKKAYDGITYWLNNRP